MKNKYLINNANIEIDFENKYVSSIFYNEEELIAGKVPFFKIKMRDDKGNHHYIDAFEFEFSGYSNDTYSYKNKELDVILTIEASANSLIWKIDVLNKTSLLIEQVEVVSIGLYPKLMDEGGKGEFIYPFNEGVRVTSVTRRELSAFKHYDVDYPSLGVYPMFPNMLFAPFMAYIVRNKGLYFGMHDSEYTPKHIDFKVENNVLKTIMSSFTNIDYGQDYHMNYECCLTFFSGDYFDACEIYRNWFKSTNSHKYKTIKENYGNLPKWYHDSPIVLTYPVVGKKDSDLEMEPGGLYPYTNGLSVVDYYSKLSDSKVMVVLMQWESTAPWAPPYVWPPYGDINNFIQYRDELHKNGHYLGVYTSGFGYTLKSFRRNYDKTDEFEKENIGDIVCVNTDGSMKSTIVDEIRFGYDICPALEKSKLLFINEAKKMIDTDLDYIQILDQNHGGNPYFCYSNKHGHVPAPGKWQVEETIKLLQRIDRKKCLLGCESAASEPYIGELLFSDNRYILNYHIDEPIPMYSYIYHEYVNNFMGNQICYALSDERYSLTYRMAYSFINGDMFTLVIDGDGKLHIAWCNDLIINDDMPLKLIKNTNKWRIGQFEEYLHYGMMVKPIKYKCNQKTFKFKWAEHTFYFDAVLSAAYSNGVDKYQFFVNYDNIDEAISLDNKNYLVYLDSNKESQMINGKEIIVPALSAIAVKIN